MTDRKLEYAKRLLQHTKEEIVDILYEFVSKHGGLIITYSDGYDKDRLSILVVDGEGEPMWMNVNAVKTQDGNLLIHTYDQYTYGGIDDENPLDHDDDYWYLFDDSADVLVMESAWEMLYTLPQYVQENNQN